MYLFDPDFHTGGESGNSSVYESLVIKKGKSQIPKDSLWGGESSFDVLPGQTF